jgi:hypothetical protein
MEILILIVAVIGLICMILTLLELISDKGIVWGILGLCICQLIVFIYGWGGLGKKDVNVPMMATWTVCILLNIILNVVMVMQAP